MDLAAQEVMEGVSAGLSDEELKQKYTLWSEERQNYFNQILEAGLFKQSEIEAGASLFQMTLDRNSTTEKKSLESAGISEGSDVPVKDDESSSKNAGDHGSRSSSTAGKILEEKLWYEDNKIIILLLILFAPLGLFHLWKTSQFRENTKIILTIIVAVVMVIFLDKLLVLWGLVMNLYALYHLYQTTRLTKITKVAVGGGVLVFLILILGSISGHLDVTVAPSGANVTWQGGSKKTLPSLSSVPTESSQTSSEDTKQLIGLAGQGDAESQLGPCYYSDKNLSEAAKNFQRAAEQGYPEAQYGLGWMYAEGRGVPKDETKAVEWYRRSAEQGYPEAQYGLGWMYAEGQGVPKDETKAVEWYRKAAEQGYPEAQYNLGVRYSGGSGVPKDEVKAVEWFRKAAEQGHAKAQFNLGWMYSGGRGIPEEEVKAAKWFRKAAEQGHATAQFTLGWMYAGGRGVPKDEVKAVEWFRKAAGRGYPD